MYTITEDSIVRKKRKLLSTKVNSDTVMMDTEQGKYFGMSPIATVIWDKIESAIKVSELCEYLLSISDVEKSVCSQQTIAFLQQLSNKNLIDIENT